MTPPPSLTPDELRRYARHLILPEIGDAGQRKLKGARVLLVGAGGLGSPAALYLAAAGVGTIGLVDDDVVDESNLHRQVLHGTSRLGERKVLSAADRLRDLNPRVEVESFDTRLAAENALEVLRDFDVIVDGSDNFPTRYLVNDACVLLGRPNVYGSIFRFEGQASVFAPPKGPCYRCLFRDPPPPELVPSCAEAGVLGVLPGVIGTLQALEAIKLITNVGTPLIGRLVLFDALGLKFRELGLRRDPECPICGERPSIRELIDYEAFCGVSAVSATAVPTPSIEVVPGELRAALDAGREMTLLDVRERWEWEIARLDAAVLVPLGELPDRLGELDRARPIVTYCHTGVRSLVARDLLIEAGFGDVRSLRGGIDAWARDLDPAVARY